MTMILRAVMRMSYFCEGEFFSFFFVFFNFLYFFEKSNIHKVPCSILVFFVIILIF